MKWWLALLTGVAFAQGQPWDAEAARAYFAEARSLCEKDAGQLWGVSLCGPMLFVDPPTRRFVANEPVEATVLPPGMAVGNMAVDWNGRKWTMVMWPLPKDPMLRAALLMHESWHRVQEGIGLPMANPANAHLDSLGGRYWIQLEWRALAKALESEGEARLQAIGDALAFRKARRALFADAAIQERGLEMNEGLAGYTGCALSGEPLRCALYELRRGATQPSFVRAFAYASGPAYGLLLDGAGPAWRKGLKPEDDFGALLARLAKAEPGSADRAAAYQGAELRAREEVREQERVKRAAEYRAKLVDGPVLVLPLKKGASFDPRKQTPFGEMGNVFGYLEANEEWGSLKAEGGALVKKDWSAVVVPAPKPGGKSGENLGEKPGERSGDGWVLKLAPGWKLVAGSRAGDWTVAKE